MFSRHPWCYQEFRKAGLSGYPSSGGAVIFSNDLETSWASVCSLTQNNDVRLYLVTYKQLVADDFDTSCMTKAFVIGHHLPPPNPYNTSGNDTIDEEDFMSNDLVMCTKYLNQRANLDLTLLNFPAILSQSFTLSSDDSYFSFSIVVTGLWGLWKSRLLYCQFFLQTFSSSSNASLDIGSTTSTANTYFYVDTCRNIDMHPPSSLLSVWIGNQSTTAFVPYDSTVQEFLDGPIASVQLFS